MIKTLGRLMEDSLKLMFDNMAKNISISTQSEYEKALRDNNYARRLFNIYSAISSGVNQAILSKGFMTEVFQSITPTIKLSMIQGCAVSGDDVETVLMLCDGDFYSADYYIVNDICNVQAKTDDATYFVFYNRRERLRDSDTGDYKAIDNSAQVTDILDVPDDVFNALAYWVKGVLYEIDEPELAERAKKSFYEILKPKAHNLKVLNYSDEFAKQDYINVEREL